MHHKIVSLAGTVALIGGLIEAPAPAFSQTRPVPQPEKIWGASNVTVYRNSPKYFSDSGNHYLAYQADGNLVIRTKTEQFVWGLNTVTNQFGSTQRITFANGNIMAFDQSGKVVWQAITAPNAVDPAARPFLTDAGVLRMLYCRSSAGRIGGVFWASDNKIGFDLTSGRECGPLLPDGTMPLSPRQVMVKGRKYWSTTGGHYLIFEPDGNLVVYTSDAKKVWGLDQLVPNVKAQNVELAVDGNLGVSGPNNQFIWSALSKDPDPRAWLDLNPAGVLQLISDRRGIQWASDGKLGRYTAPEDCKPYDRWAQCVALASPRIKIMSTRAVSSSAVNVVKQIYTEMTSALKPQHPMKNFDGFIVYITNGEPWSHLNGIGPIGPDLGANNTGDELRGGASLHYLWITEQMICKTGVKTRGDKDKEVRTFDQVVHEFGHSIEANFNLHGYVDKLFANSNSPREDFPWRIQYWYGAPAGELTNPEKQFLAQLFSRQKTFACSDYNAGK